MTQGTRPAAEKRQGPDRRRQPRGGRRPTDTDGLAPLVMVVGDENVGLAEAILAKLRFAVATSSSVEDAARVVSGLKPDIVVAAASDAGALRGKGGHAGPVVEMTEAMKGDPLALIEAIRETLRRR